MQELNILQNKKHKLGALTELQKNGHRQNYRKQKSVCGKKNLNSGSNLSVESKGSPLKPPLFYR